MTFLAQGDLAGTRAVVKATPPGVAPVALVVEMAAWRATLWVLDVEQRALVLRLTPIAFDEDRGFWGRCLAQGAALNGDIQGTHRYAEEARRALEEQGMRSGTPFSGLALAYLGRKEEQSGRESAVSASLRWRKMPRRVSTFG